MSSWGQLRVEQVICKGSAVSIKCSWEVREKGCSESPSKELLECHTLWEISSASAVAKMAWKWAMKTFNSCLFKILWVVFDILPYANKTKDSSTFQKLGSTRY